MDILKRLSAILVATVLVTGCASIKTDDWKSCAMVGAAMGGAAGGFGDDHDHEDFLLSAVGGAVIGGTVCALMAEDEVVAPVTPVAPVDSDGDGVVDGVDACPETPQGAAVDSKGCALDSDNDGVADYKDQCPDSAAGAVVNELGCAKPFVLEGVNFHTNSAELTDEAKSILLPIATSHNAHHADVDLLISGHTDSMGAEAYNLSLSQKRAEAVMAFMVSNGSDAAKLTAVGHGESQPVADNGTKEGRAKNRRVELTVKK